MWLVAFATHLHNDADELSSKAPSTACSYCLSLPSGATPPVHASFAVPRFIVTEFVEAVVKTLAARDVPSSYSSRGPPAR